MSFSLFFDILFKVVKKCMAEKKKKGKRKISIGKKEFLFDFFSLVFMLGVGLYFGYRSLYYYSSQNQKRQAEAQTLNGTILQTTPVAMGEDSGLHHDSEGYYFKGNVENNYVAFANQLFRIVRIYEDNKVKIVSENHVASFPWGNESEYKNSNVENWLDITSVEHSGIYYATLPNVKKFFAKGNYQMDTLAEDKIISAKEKQKSYITPLSVTDYVLANGKNSYLNTEESFFLLGMTEKKENLYVDVDGSIQSCDSVEGHGIRPVLILKENTTITGGKGTLGDPYVIFQDTDTNFVYSYVKLGDDMWRVFEQKDGILRLSYTGYLSKNGEEVVIPYSQTNSIFDLGDRKNIAYYLNSTYFSSLSYQDVLLSFDSYIGEISDDLGYQFTNIYNNAVNAKVGLLNIFDPNVNTELEDYYHVNTTSEVGSMAYNVYKNGFLFESDVREEKHIVPVISIQADKIKSGVGSLENPYVMEG